MPDILRSRSPFVGAAQARVRGGALKTRASVSLRSFGGMSWKVLGRLETYKPPSPAPIAPFPEGRDFASLGLHPFEAAAFQSLADENAYDIFVRTGNASRVANVGRPGRRPKPAGVYQKTSKGTFAPGLVLYEDKDVEKAHLDLYEARRRDRSHKGAAYRLSRALAREDLYPDESAPGMSVVRDGTGNTIYGDIDIHGVYSRREGRSAGRIGGRTFVPLFNAELMKTGLHAPSLLKNGTPMVTKRYGVLPHHPIQHGAHDAWAKRNDTSYAGGVNMGPLPGVIHFQPNAKPRHIPTVAGYKRILQSLGHGRNYTEAAWSNGQKRDAFVARLAGR